MGYSSKINDPAFENYAEIKHRGPSTILEERKKEISKIFKEHYFPGDLKAKPYIGATFKEKNGPFKDAIWTIKATKEFVGMFSGVGLEHPKYEFKTVKTADMKITKMKRRTYEK